MQEELGSDGVYAYMQDNLKGIAARDYQLLVNLLPELKNTLCTDLIKTRIHQSISDCDDMFIRHIGVLTTQQETIRKQIKNPFSCFSEGIKCIVSMPILLLKLFGIISNSTTSKIENTILMKFLNFFAIITGFISSIVTIVIGWDEFVEIIDKLF